MHVYRGQIVTCDPQTTLAQYLVEHAGMIRYIGPSLPSEYESAPQIDLGEQALLPAFSDTHIHFSSWAFFASQLYFQHVSSFADLQRMVQEFAERRTDKIIIGFGVSAHNLKEGRLPTKIEMDEWTPRPLYLVKYDGHAAIGNSAFLTLIPDSVRTSRGFHTETGHFNQEAFFKATDFVTNSVSPLKLLKNMQNGVDLLASRGIGMIHTVEGIGFPKDLDVDIVRMVAKGQRAGFQFRIFFQTMEVAKVLKRKLPRIGGCFATALDGCFGSEDAALLAPYSNNATNTGILFYSEDQVVNFCRAAHQAGLQIQMHAIGDGAFKQAVQALSQVLHESPRPDHRHTIIHACLPTEEGLKLCAANKIAIASQPAFLNWDQEPLSYLQTILGERVRQISPHRSLLDLGLHVAGGSDGPCTSPDPIAGIHAVCNHFNPAQSVSIPEALRMFTAEASYLSFDEKTRGTLEVGKIADMVILDRNPLHLSPSNLHSLTVQEILLHGRRYRTHRSLPNLLLTSWTKGSNVKI